MKRIGTKLLSILLCAVMFLTAAPYCAIPAYAEPEEEPSPDAEALRGETGFEEADWPWGDKPCHVQHFDKSGLLLSEGNVTYFEELTEGANPIEPRCEEGWIYDMEGEHLWDCTDYVHVSCAEKGVRAYKCLFCGMMQYIYEKPFGHVKGSAVPGSYHEPTCTEEGCVTYSCVYCDETYAETIPALGHSWVLNEEVSSEPQVRQSGKYVYYCAREGCADHTGMTTTKTIKLEALGSYRLSVIREDIGSGYEFYFEYGCQLKYPKPRNGQTTVTVAKGTSLQKYHDEAVITGGSLTTPSERAGTVRLVSVIYAQQIYSENTLLSDIHAYCDVTVDTRGMNGVKLDVYLVGFGATTTMEVNGKECIVPTKGLGNVNIIGSSANVYLVDSNIGFIDCKGAAPFEAITEAGQGEGEDYYPVMGAENPVRIFLDGWSSRLYMGPDTNKTNSGAVHCEAVIHSALLKGMSYDPTTPQYPFWCDP